MPASPWHTVSGPATTDCGGTGCTVTGKWTVGPTHNVVEVKVSVTVISSVGNAIPGTASAIMKYIPMGDVLLSEAGTVHA